MLKVSPSILSADFLRLGEDIAMLNEGADYIHLDIMDGELVPNISYGFPIVEAVSRIATIPMDAHLMIKSPQRYFDRFIEAGVKMLSFHLEATEKDGSNPKELISYIKSKGVQAGLAFNPDYPIEKVLPHLSYADYVIVMSVYAGFGGQKFIGEAMNRVESLKKHIVDNGYHCRIEVDGGVNAQNARELENRGADIVVAGSAVFKAEHPKAVISELRGH